MSIENHPNINAAGLAAHSVEGIIKYSRGAMAGNKALTPRIMEYIESFCLIVSCQLDLEASGFSEAVNEAFRGVTAEPNADFYMAKMYPVVMYIEGDGVTVTHPDLPGCAAYGDTPNEAIEALDRTRRLWIEGRVEAHLPVPIPNRKVG